MGEDKKNPRTYGREKKLFKDGLDYIAQKILANVSSPITERVEKVTRNIEDRIIDRITRAEENVIRKMFSFVVIGFGAIFLVFALFFYLRESLGWSSSAGYFAISILMFAIGLVLNAGYSKR